MDLFARYRGKSTPLTKSEELRNFIEKCVLFPAANLELEGSEPVYNIGTGELYFERTCRNDQIKSHIMTLPFNELVDKEGNILVEAEYLAEKISGNVRKLIEVPQLNGILLWDIFGLRKLGRIEGKQRLKDYDSYMT
ncbi:Uncharacterised protein [uncultured archaeon]|nr:Uncharacterised protein [uncultured archaeon]